MSEKMSPIRAFEVWRAFAPSDKPITLDISMRADGWHYSLDARLALGRASSRYVKGTIQETFGSILSDLGLAERLENTSGKTAGQVGDP